MGDASREPLLDVSVAPVGDADREDSPAEVQRAVEADLQRSLWRHPREAIKYLEERGVTKLGTLKVQSTKVKDLVQDANAMRTFGSEVGRELDWEREWRSRLGAEKPPERGAEWQPVTSLDAWVVNVPHSADADDAGIINPLIKRYMDGVCGIRVFAYPAVKATVSAKWDTWARRYLTMEMADYVVWLVAFQVFALLLQDEDTSASLGEVLRGWRGVATVAAECLAYAAMLPFLFIEWRSIVEYREDWFNAWNCLDVAAYILQTAVLVMHLSRWHVDSNAFSVLCALQVLLLWVRLQYFARVLQPTRQPFMETLRSVLHEVKWFLLLLLLLVIAFANSLQVLMRKDQDKKEFRTAGMSAVTMFAVMTSGFEADLFSESHNPAVALSLLVLFVFIMSLVLLNCLIALMSDAAAKVSDSEGWQFMLSRAQIIDELETTLPWFLKRRNAATWYPKHVHFLTLNRDDEDQRRLEVGGSRTGESEPAEAGGDGGGQPADGPSAAELRAAVGGLQAEVAQLHAKLRLLLQLQEAIAGNVLSDSQVAAIKEEA